MTKKILDAENLDCNVIHEDVIASVKKKMPEETVLMDLADLFKVFGDSTRVKILCALMRSEMCVCDISALLGMSKSAISHQLRTLRQTRLVKYRREGKVVYYSLEDEHVGTIFDQGLIHVSE
jgi:DNA-binding transcriptional ArsR family regulator